MSKAFRYFLEFVLLLTLVGTFNLEPPDEIPTNIANIMQSNRVILTCGDKGGQGTITNVDQTGVWIRTAGHVTAGEDSCDAMFADYGQHTAYVSKQYVRSDEAVLFVSRAYWPTHAAIAPLRLGEKLYAYGTIHIERDPQGFPAAALIPNTDMHTGYALLPVLGAILHAAGYPAPPNHLVLTNLFSAPGSSGGGVYDEQGNLVGIVSGGSVINHNETMILNVVSSMEDEP